MTVKVIPAMLVSLLLLAACSATKVVSDQDGRVVVKGPRAAWGPNTLTADAQKEADAYCASRGRSKAVFMEGEVRLFDGDYNKFQCSVPSEDIYKRPEVQAAFGNIGTCVRKNVVVYDDFTSDVKSVSEAIGTICGPEINAFVDRFLAEKNQTPDYDLAFRTSFVDNQYKKILPFVLAWRKLVREGRPKEAVPTERELPNSLLGV